MPSEKGKDRGNFLPNEGRGELNSILYYYKTFSLLLMYAKTSWNDVKLSKSSGSTKISNSSSTTAISVAVARESQVSIVVELARVMSW